MANAPLKEQALPSKDAYITWDTKNNSAIGKSLEVVEPIYRSNASAYNQFRSIEPNVSVRDGFTRFDYEYFRNNETIPRKQKAIIAMCLAAYSRVGIIRNIIDLMGDFGSQGVRIVHPDPETEDFYNNWFVLVNGKERSERFLNLLYRTGNVIVKRCTGRIKNDQARKMMKSLASPDSKIQKPQSISPNEIPIRYLFLDPMSIELVAPTLSVFSGKTIFGIRVSNHLRDAIKAAKTASEKELLKEIPKDLIESLDKLSPDQLYILDSEKVFAYYYKKDDWMPWATPMIYAILDDLILLEKFKLADLTALDGAISKIRIWKLGDHKLDVPLFPTDAVIEKFSNILMNTAGNGSVMDLIWNSAIELAETSTDVVAFLGSEKYEATLASIYGGLGIPQVLRGNSGGGGMTTDFVQIKTLVERLVYGRNILNGFWKQELDFIRRSMKGYPGFDWKNPPEVIYDHLSLTDEASQTKLILDILDRDIIPVQTAREELGYPNKIQDARLNKERANRKKAPKVSPYHAAQPDHDLKKIALQKGVVTPSEVGLELEAKKPGEVPAIKMAPPKVPGTPGTKKKKGTPGQGRPKNSTDKTKRKQRIPLVASEIDLFLWTQSTYAKVSDFVTPIYLKHVGKSNLRKLSDLEFESYEELKFGVLSNIEPLQEINDVVIKAAIHKNFENHKMILLYNEMCQASKNELSLDQKRQLRCLAYTRSFLNENS